MIMHRVWAVVRGGTAKALCTLYWELTNDYLPLLSQVLPTLAAETVPAPCPVDDPPFIVVDPAYRHSVAQALFYKVERTREKTEREREREKE